MTTKEPHKHPFLVGMIAAAFVVAFMLLLSSCKARQVIVTHAVHDTTYIAKVQRDSIYMQDSVFIREKGDTIRIEKWHTKCIERVRWDTLQVLRSDSIPVPYEVEVEKIVVPKFYKVCTWLWWVLLASVLLAVVARVLIRIYLHR